jgi:hypothetical protein
MAATLLMELALPMPVARAGVGSTRIAPGDF